MKDLTSDKGEEIVEKRIEGEKVILRRPVDSDAAFFARWYNEPDVMAKCGFTENTTREKELGILKVKTEIGLQLWIKKVRLLEKPACCVCFPNGTAPISPLLSLTLKNKEKDMGRK
ncbi:GNAT family N-acetyltransferase [Anaerocolumna jejuensis]|uniref:GNAT family N-acetyltransferase n=1 Tax=Anaerocolumna jejuensis TaxID=259063 RepID=UPI003F7C0FDD